MSDEFLDLIATILLRLVTPIQAHSVLRTIGTLLPKRRGRDNIRSAAIRLKRRGTCLSRALALSARSPDADVVIGVLPPGRRQLALAHAWLELEGAPIDASEVVGVEIARLPLKRFSR
jgi:hypothetical protein